MAQSPRYSQFMRTMTVRYSNDQLALKVINGRTDDGSYERAREAFKAARGNEAMAAFDREAKEVYRHIRDNNIIL